MPMFHTPKPRQFHYQPRFYDPEKEKWESLKKKYADAQEKAQRPTDDQEQHTTEAANSNDGKDLAYFERRVWELDREERATRSKLKFSDLFRKREMPTFHYQPRFGSNEGTKQVSSVPDTEGHETTQRILKHKIQRRFDISNEDYLKPIDGGKIVLYGIVATLLLLWVLL